MASATDNFNRAAIGANWTQASTSTIAISASTIATGAAGGVECVAYWNATAFGSDQYSEFELVTTNQDGGGPMVRHQSGSQVCYYLYFAGSGSGNAIGIWKKSGAGSFTSLDSGTVSTSAGDTLRLEISGSNLTAYHNGTPILSGTDSAITGGQPGIFLYSNSFQLDNWEGGDLGVADLPAEEGSYVVTGTAASLERGYRLFAEPAGS